MQRFAQGIHEPSNPWAVLAKIFRGGSHRGALPTWRSGVISMLKISRARIFPAPSIRSWASAEALRHLVIPG